MRLQNDICSVDITVDSTYTIDSADNKHYDLVLNPDDYYHNDFSNTLAIAIDIFAKTFNIALIGSFYSYDTDCAVIDGDILTVMQNNTITQLNVLNGEMTLHKHFECFGCNFGLYKVKLGYVVYGEIQILMLDQNFEVKWRFSGKDIFVSCSGKTPFKLCENSIRLYDFNDEYYEIDYNGNNIR